MPRMENFAEIYDVPNRDRICRAFASMAVFTWDMYCFYNHWNRDDHKEDWRCGLEVDGGRVLGVGTSAGALEALERSRFDVVFLDLWLQAESGLAVLREIVRRQPEAGVIVITAYASFETAVEAMKMGAVRPRPD